MTTTAFPERQECRQCGEHRRTDEFEPKRRVCRRCRRNPTETRRLRTKIAKLTKQVANGPGPLERLQAEPEQCSGCGKTTRDLPGSAPVHILHEFLGQYRACRACVLLAHREALIKRMLWSAPCWESPQSILKRMMQPEIRSRRGKGGRPFTILDPSVESMERGQYTLARKDAELAEALSLEVGD